jgi:hypothetical protein
MSLRVEFRKAIYRDEGIKFQVPYKMKNYHTSSAFNSFSETNLPLDVSLYNLIYCEVLTAMAM